MIADRRLDPGLPDDDPTPTRSGSPRRPTPPGHDQHPHRRQDDRLADDPRFTAGRSRLAAAAGRLHRRPTGTHRSRSSSHVEPGCVHRRQHPAGADLPGPAAPCVADIAGPLIIEGGTHQGPHHPARRPAARPRPTSRCRCSTIIVDETQKTDTLNVFNDGSVAADTGALGCISTTGQTAGRHALAPIYDGARPRRSTRPRSATSPASAWAAPADARLRHPRAGHPHLRRRHHLPRDRGRRHPARPGQRHLHGDQHWPGRSRSCRAAAATTRSPSPAAAAPDSPLVVFGDTSQDGRFYDYDDTTASRPAAAAVRDPATTSSTPAPRPELGRRSTAARGNDTIWGSQAGDHLAGGSGNDTIHGQGGDDHIYGDDGFNLDLSKRLTWPSPRRPRSCWWPQRPAAWSRSHRETCWSPGNDTIHGDGGNDIVFGDLGRIDQAAGHQRIPTTGFVVGVVVGAARRRRRRHDLRRRRRRRPHRRRRRRPHRRQRRRRPDLRRQRRR